MNGTQYTFATLCNLLPPLFNYIIQLEYILKGLNQPPLKFQGVKD